jgi:hypothetical protein
MVCVRSSHGQCSLDTAGFFGLDSKITFEITFKYEIEYQGGKVPNFYSSVVPVIEEAFNSALLPSLFPEICADSNSTLNVVGLSTAPEDTVDSSLACLQSVSSSNLCEVFSGALTVYMNDNSISFDQKEISKLVLSVIQKGMDNGEFASVHEIVKRVSMYTTDESSSSTSSSTSGGEGESGGQTARERIDRFFAPILEKIRGNKTNTAILIASPFIAFCVLATVCFFCTTGDGGKSGEDDDEYDSDAE